MDEKRQAGPHNQQIREDPDFETESEEESRENFTLSSASEKEESSEAFFFETIKRNKRDKIQQKQGRALFNATGGNGHGMKGTKGIKSEDLEVDEAGTVSLIEHLDETNRKILNGLVQGVLQSQKENDKDKLQILTKKRKLIQEQAMIEKTKLVA